MKTQLDLFDKHRETRRDLHSKSDVERLVSQPPWLMTDKPWHWRQRQLQRGAEEHGRRLIDYRKGYYGESLIASRAAAAAFYKEHELAAINAAG